MTQELPAEMLAQMDRVAIIDLVQRERVARDMRQWDELANCYLEDSLVEISWFRGTGAEFAAASKKIMAGPLRSFHQMGPTVVKLMGDRAVAGTGCAIHVAGDLDGVGVDVISQSRLYSRVQRHGKEWLLQSLRSVYIEDAMIPLDPSQTPKLNAAELASYRPSYRLIQYMLAHAGHPTRSDLPGMDQPEGVAKLQEADEAWLMGR